MKGLAPRPMTLRVYNNRGSMNGATWTPSGKVSGALSYDGTQGSVQIPNSPSLASATNRMTVAAWVYPTNTTGEWRTLAQRDDGTGSWYDWQIYTRDSLTGNRPSFRIEWNGNGTIDANEEVEGDIVLSANTWYFITVTYDGSALRLYIDGTLRGTTNAVGTIPNSGQDIWIGGNGVWGEHFAGRIDEVRIYNTALTQVEIQALKDAGPAQWPLTVSKAGTGSGTVISNPVGINCGADCSETYNNNTLVDLTANPSTGSNFAGWSGDCSTSGQVTMTANKNCTATFNPIQYTLTVTKAGTGTGTVLSTPSGISCGGTAPKPLGITPS